MQLIIRLDVYRCKQMKGLSGKLRPSNNIWNKTLLLLSEFKHGNFGFFAFIVVRPFLFKFVTGDS